MMAEAFAIFANHLVMDDQGVPTNARAAEHRAAEWIREYMTGQQPERDWEVALY